MLIRTHTNISFRNKLSTMKGKRFFLDALSSLPQGSSHIFALCSRLKIELAGRPTEDCKIVRQQKEKVGGDTLVERKGLYWTYFQACLTRDSSKGLRRHIMLGIDRFRCKIQSNYSKTSFYLPLRTIIWNVLLVARLRVLELPKNKEQKRSPNTMSQSSTLYIQSCTRVSRTNLYKNLTLTRLALVCCWRNSWSRRTKK